MDEEARTCKVRDDCSPLSVVLLCGISNMVRHFDLGDAEKQFAGLILTIKQHFPKAKVLFYLFCSLSIIVYRPLLYSLKMKFPKTFLK